VDPNDRKYSTEHEWAKAEGDLVVIGITDFAQDQLGDVVYVELPKAGQTIEQFKTFGVIESVKTASDLYAPVSGTIVEINGALVDEPALVNDSPYEEGWLVKVRPANPEELAREMEALLDAGAYASEVS
jgi:glycine cleavage system H protein